MTTFLLIRHADCDAVGKSIAGRASGVHLNDAGRAQAEALAQRLSGARLDAIYTSPLERARETAEPLGAAIGLAVTAVQGITELDFGSWTGASLTELENEPQWRQFNTLRSITRIPGGELMLEVQARALSALGVLAAEQPEGRIALVTHGDVIRSIIAHYAGIPLDLFQRIEIAPASISIVSVAPDWVSVACVNSTARLPL